MRGSGSLWEGISLPMAVRELCRDDELIPEAVMSLRIRPILTVLLLAGAASLSQAQTYTVIDYPGAPITAAVATNDAGTTVGTYGGSLSTYEHGFLRDASGNFTAFDIPNAVGVYPAGINAAGVVAGSYSDATERSYGFVRAADGTITTFSIGSPQFQNTHVAGINAAGVVVGGEDGLVGFLRGPLGGIEVLSTKDGMGAAAGINSLGDITGTHYYPHSGVAGHGYVRARDGSVVEFSAAPGYWTVPTAINDAGYVTGYYVGSETRPDTGFVRDPAGNVTQFEGPPDSAYIDPYPASINAEGSITGWVSHPKTGKTRGFLRRADGTIFEIGPPNIDQVYPSNINNEGVVTGTFSTGSSEHGFIRTP